MFIFILIYVSICSDIGDIYTWGWNESGQLGLPCQNAESSDAGTTTIQNFRNSKMQHIDRVVGF